MSRLNQELAQQNARKSLNSNYSTKQTKSKGVSPGFTIVELLIVVVVIAILAAITIVSYNGITKSAKETTLKSDLNTAAKQLQLEKVRDGSFPTKEEADLKSSAGTEFAYTPGTNTFCLQASNPSLPDKTFHITEAGSIEEGNCPEGGTTMQTFTASQCNNLPVYTGSNESAVITLSDNRGGIERTYQVAKLVDNNCWMLNNLKLGSTTGTITLTPADTNIASNFTLPQLYSGTSNSYISYDTPYAYGPVPGDTGSGATNYGYLYNWPAATAGETQATMPAGSGNAPHSICPAGWRLPGGGDSDGTGNEFSYLNARMAGFSNNQDSTYLDNYWNYYSNWKNTGPFKGAFSGYWWEGFDDLGDFGGFWSRSAHPDASGRAFYAGFGAGEVDPGGVSDHGGGVGVRCLLN